MDVAARIEGLEAENARLRERIAQLEAAMGMALITPLEWRLTPAEMRVFGVIMAREMATKDAVMAALYRDEGRDEAEIKIVDVFVCKIRRKLKPFGIGIETVWGRGYRMGRDAKALAEAQIGGVFA